MFEYHMLELSETPETVPHYLDLFDLCMGDSRETAATLQLHDMGSIAV